MPRRRCEGATSSRATKAEAGWLLPGCLGGERDHFSWRLGMKSDVADDMWAVLGDPNSEGLDVMKRRKSSARRGGEPSRSWTIRASHSQASRSVAVRRRTFTDDRPVSTASSTAGERAR